MEKLACEACGSTDLVKQGDYFVCQFCGIKYTQSDLKKMLGTVKIDNTDKLSNLYQIARRAKDDNNSENAAKYYDMILIEDPTSWEASFYLVYFKARSCKIAHIQSAAISMSNCLDTVLKLISEHVFERAKQIEAVQEVAVRSISMSGMLYTAAENHYNGIDPQIRNKYGQEMVNNCSAARDISYILGNNIDSIFGDYEELQPAAVSAWKNGVSQHSRLMAQLSQKEASNNVITNYVNKIHKYDPSYQAPAVSVAKSGCYIATAVYGSYDCPQVWTLRRYRDYTLAKTWYGRAFIHTYYAISPSLVKLFGHTKWFKQIWQGKLDCMVAKLKAQGVKDTPYQDISW